MLESVTHNRILLVDDEDSNLRALTRVLAREGLTDVISSADPHQARPLFIEYRPDLVVLDLRMPKLDGFAVMDQLRPLIPAGSFLPILVLTGDTDPIAKRRALAMGARDLLAKPFDMIEVVLRIRNLLETRALHLRLESHNLVLEAKVLERTRELDDTQLEMLQRLAAAGEVRDDDTGQHTYRVGAMAGRLARGVGLGEEEARLIHQAAPLHDVGKIGIPDSVLLKRGALTAAEFDVIKMHTLIGARVLNGGRCQVVNVAERIARSHHERWNGTGYPDGLAGQAIPIEARLVAIVDVFDALTHDRPYRPAWPLPKVLAAIQEQRGQHFEPRIVDAFLEQDWTEFTPRTSASEHPDEFHVYAA